MCRICAICALSKAAGLLAASSILKIVSHRIGDLEKMKRLSLGSVDPAPHTEHLLGPFAAIAQNSSLRSFSIVDSLANRQHSCRGSEELAIRKTARFQATPSYSELLRVGGAQELRATPSCSEPLRATPSEGRPRTPSYSEPLQATPSYSELLRATPSYSELLRATPSHSKLLRATPSGGAPKNSELLRAAPRNSELRAQSPPSPELQALLGPYNCAASWQETPLLRSSKVKNSELWLQMAPASAVCGELGLPSLERERLARAKSSGYWKLLTE